jgi:NDP-sugar pyrophosphorylase family protein
MSDKPVDRAAGSISKAFVLGAGLGTRLRPLTDSRPKPLVPVFNKPLITFAFDHLLHAGVQKFVVNTHHRPEAYERLILDVLLGEPPLFPRQKEVELSWKILDPIVNYWEKNGFPEAYAPGSWGPDSAHRMLDIDGRSWRRP